MVKKLPTHMGSVKIMEFGCWIPENVLESSHIQKGINNALPELNGYDICKRAGVTERREAPEGMTVVEMGALAACDAIRNAQSNNNDIHLEDIDTVIFCSVCRMYAEPSTASLIQKKIGIHSATSFDISNACLGFLDGLIVVDSFIASGKSKLALIIGAEKGCTVLKNSYNAMINRERGTECMAALTLGDGAVAALICPDSYSGKTSLSFNAYSRTTLSHYADLSILPSMEKPMFVDSKALFDGALLHGPDMIHNLLNDIGWTKEDIDLFIPHQPSIKIIKAGLDSMGLPIEKCPITLDSFGNMASVSIPFTLQKILNENQVLPGGKILLMGYGSGLSFSMMALEVCENIADVRQAIV